MMGRSGMAHDENQESARLDRTPKRNPASNSAMTADILVPTQKGSAALGGLDEAQHRQSLLKTG